MIPVHICDTRHLLSRQVWEGSYLHLHRRGSRLRQPVQRDGHLRQRDHWCVPRPGAVWEPSSPVRGLRCCLQGHEETCQRYLHRHIRFVSFCHALETSDLMSHSPAEYELLLCTAWGCWTALCSLQVTLLPQFTNQTGLQTATSWFSGVGNYVWFELMLITHDYKLLEGFKMDRKKVWIALLIATFSLFI